MAREMFTALTDQHSSAAGKDVSWETFISGETSSYSYIQNTLGDAFPYILDGELPICKKVFCDLM